MEWEKSEKSPEIWVEKKKKMNIHTHFMESDEVCVLNMR